MDRPSVLLLATRHPSAQNHVAPEPVAKWTLDFSPRKDELWFLLSHCLDVLGQPSVSPPKLDPPLTLLLPLSPQKAKKTKPPCLLLLNVRLRAPVTTGLCSLLASLPLKLYLVLIVSETVRCKILGLRSDELCTVHSEQPECLQQPLTERITRCNLRHCHRNMAHSTEIAFAASWKSCY